MKNYISRNMNEPKSFDSRPKLWMLNAWIISTLFNVLRKELGLILIVQGE